MSYYKDQVTERQETERLALQAIKNYLADCDAHVALYWTQDV